MGTQEVETVADQIRRVRSMAEDNRGDTWDLSDNDVAALTTVLAQRDALIAVCRDFVAWQEWYGEGPQLKPLPAILATMRSLLQSATGAPEDAT